jgi:hypothetical protein
VHGREVPGQLCVRRWLSRLLLAGAPLTCTARTQSTDTRTSDPTCSTRLEWEKRRSGYWSKTQTRTSGAGPRPAEALRTSLANMRRRSCSLCISFRPRRTWRSIGLPHSRPARCSNRHTCRSRTHSRLVRGSRRSVCLRRQASRRRSVRRRSARHRQASDADLRRDLRAARHRRRPLQA